MITLKTLDQATAQQVFDQVASHLLTQNARCENNISSCQYRNDDGLKCAAGCLIADDEYQSRFEGDGWSLLVSKYQFPQVHKDLIRYLQAIHDNHEPTEWKDNLIELAQEYNLSDSVAREFEYAS